VDELERWIAPVYTAETPTLTSAVAPFAAPTVPEQPVAENQLRATQIFLGAFAGYATGHWLMGQWPVGIALAVVGVVLAYFNRTRISVSVCLPLSIAIAHWIQRPWLEPIDPFKYIVAVPLGLILGTFLSDFWRFSVLPDDPGHPVQPSGINVDADTRLVVGSIVLAPSQGRWYRAQVVGFEEPNRVRVRFVGWSSAWNEVVSRGELQIDQGVKRDR
jgi:hypothetical protein